MGTLAKCASPLPLQMEWYVWGGAKLNGDSGKMCHSNIIAFLVWIPTVFWSWQNVPICFPTPPRNRMAHKNLMPMIFWICGCVKWNRNNSFVPTAPIRSLRGQPFQTVQSSCCRKHHLCWPVDSSWFWRRNPGKSCPAFSLGDTCSSLDGVNISSLWMCADKSWNFLVEVCCQKLFHGPPWNEVFWHISLNTMNSRALGFSKWCSDGSAFHCGITHQQPSYSVSMVDR